jgi:DNA-binding transcriptional LysR family regulator
MTPSAVSHALKRLRHTFNDPLFERRASGMIPTQRARELAPFVRNALQSLNQGIALSREFDPATSQRTFRIRQSDFMSNCLMPRLCVRIRAQAPGVRLIVNQLSQDDGEPYQAGDIELRAGGRLGDRVLRRKRIWHDQFAVAMRRGHPAGNERLTLDRFLKLPFLDIASVLIDRKTLDDVLRTKGAVRRTAVTIPTLAGAVAVIAYTDLCAVLPKCWVTLYSAPSELAMQSLPVTGIDYNIDMVWHAREEKDPGHRWLRGLIEEELNNLFSPPPSQPQAHRIGYLPSRLDVVPTLTHK